MDEATQEEFQMDKLVQWFVLNIRTLSHIKVTKDSITDQEWLEEKERATHLTTLSALPRPWKPHPKAYIRRGTGTGGVHYNKILRSRDERTQLTNSTKAFGEYGMAAEGVANSFDYQTRVQQALKLRQKSMNRYI